MNDLFGEKQPSDGIKEFIAWAIDEAERATGIRPDWARRSSPKEFGCLRRLHREIQPTDRLRGAWLAFLADDTPFTAGKPPSKLACSIDRFLESSAGDKAGPWAAERRVHEAEVLTDPAAPGPDLYGQRFQRYAELAETHGREKARRLASAEFPGLDPI